MADVQRTFDLMAEEVPWPDQQFDRVTLAYLVLPMAALYTALRDRGRTEQDAVAAVTRALGVLLVRVERLMIGSLSRTRPGRRLLFEATSALSDALLAVTGPAWEATRVERSRNRMAVDVTRCYIVDTLRLLDAAPAAAVMCANDTAAYEGVCPKVRFTRTGSLGTGADNGSRRGWGQAAVWMSGRALVSTSSRRKSHLRAETTSRCRGFRV